MKIGGRKVRLDTPGATQPPQVRAAPGMVDRKMMVVRREGESDAQYQSRQALFELLLADAKRA